jgi:hypothetical protein
MTPSIPEHRVNPRYGTGLFRRRIRLARSGQQVCAELEDDCHGFRVMLEHDGSRVTAVAGEALRVPLNTCAGALKPLQALVGVALDAPVASIVASVPPRGNCTHLFDLSLLALAHVSQPAPVRVYDVEVVDQAQEGGPARAEVFLNGESIHRWQLARMAIVEPEVHAGRPVLRGFSAWANEAFAGRELEAAMVLSRGVFVACSRMFDMSEIGGQPALNHTNMLGACYSYSEGVVEHAIRNHDTVRDFSDTPEALLTFKLD